MIYMNELMKKQFDNESGNMQDLAKEIVSNTRKIYDCLVYDKECEINETKINFDRIMMMYGDRTGYEVSCNEIRLKKDRLLKNQFTTFLVEFDREITAKFSRKVVIYIQEFEDSLELRFHSFREHEKLWLSENLDDYDIPIVCYIS